LPSPSGYLIRKASFLSLPPFISSRIHRGVAPRPAQVSLGSFLLRYFAATLRPFSFEPFGRPGFRPRLTPLPMETPPVRLASCFLRLSAWSLIADVTLLRSSIRASSDSFARLLGLAIGINLLGWFQVSGCQ